MFGHLSLRVVQEFVGLDMNLKGMNEFDAGKINGSMADEMAGMRRWWI